MNEFSPERRQQLKIVVILIAIIFFVIYGIIMLLKYTNQPTTARQIEEKQQVIFEQPKLQFFQYTQQLNAYPDRITIHYPYLVIVRPNEQRSEIYNMDSKRKEKEVSEILLDYDKGNEVYNKQGYLTYFNKINLGIMCDKAFIKSKTEILCITRPDQNKQENKLISVDPQTLTKKDIYSSPNVLTAVYFNKSTIYIGEYNFVTNKAFMTVNSQTAPIGDLVNVIYPMGDKIYAAAFKSLRNKQTESYYEIMTMNSELATKLRGKNQIIFYQSP